MSEHSRRTECIGMACSSTSASEWPNRPLSCGIRMPPSHSGRPSTSWWQSCSLRPCEMAEGVQMSNSLPFPHRLRCVVWGGSCQCVFQEHPPDQFVRPSRVCNTASANAKSSGYVILKFCGLPDTNSGCKPVPTALTSSASAQVHAAGRIPAPEAKRPTGTFGGARASHWHRRAQAVAVGTRAVVLLRRLCCLRLERVRQRKRQQSTHPIVAAGVDELRNLLRRDQASGGIMHQNPVQRLCAVRLQVQYAVAHALGTTISAHICGVTGCMSRSYGGECLANQLSVGASTSRIRHGWMRMQQRQDMPDHGDRTGWYCLGIGGPGAAFAATGAGN